MREFSLKRIRRLLLPGCLLGVFALGGPSLAFAEGAQAALPSADQVLAKYERFLGGAAALARVHTRSVQAKRVQRGAHPSEASLLRISKRPLLSIMQQSALDGSFIKYGNGCDARGGWIGSDDAAGAGRAVDGQSSTSGICQQELLYYGFLPLDLSALKANISRLEVRGVSRILPEGPGTAGALAGGRGADLVPPGPRMTYVVLSVPIRSNDTYMWLYFDAATGALLRREDAGKGPTPTQPGLNPRHTDFVQYRDVGDGTRAPFQFVSIEPDNEVRGVAESIIDNGLIPDEQFARPKDTRRQDKGL